MEMRMPYKDKEKAREYKRKWNKEYYSKHKKNEIERVKNRKERIRSWFKKYKQNLKCSKCGEDHVACLEFHHPNEKNKFFSILTAIERRGFSKERILSEIKKCTVLCANCHRKLHFK